MPPPAACNFFVGRALDPLLEVHQAWIGKYRMRVRIDKARDNHFSRAVDLRDFAAILFQPGIAESVLR